MTLRPPSSILSAFGRPSTTLLTPLHCRQTCPLYLHPSATLLRLASTSSKTSSKPSSSLPSSSVPKPPSSQSSPSPRPSPPPPKTPASPVGLESPINPPISTLPAPLDVPARAPDQSFFSYAYRTGRAYLAFYKVGVKNVWANYQLAKQTQKRLAAIQPTTELGAESRSSTTTTTSSAATKSASSNNGKTTTTTADKDKPNDKIPSPLPPPSPLSSTTLTRADWQLLHRDQRDIKRVPLFGLLLLIFGEWLPLFIIFFTKIVPYPCQIPAQIRREREKAEARRRDVFRGDEAGEAIQKFEERGRWVGEFGKEWQEGKKGYKDEGYVGYSAERVRDVVHQMSRAELVHVGRSLGLHSRLWDRFVRASHFPPTSVLQYKIKKRLAYLEIDDKLMMRDGRVQELTDEELRIACEERGIDVLGKNVMELRKTLMIWLDGRGRGDQHVLRMLLTRPSVWKI